MQSGGNLSQYVDKILNDVQQNLLKNTDELINYMSGIRRFRKSIGSEAAIRKIHNSFINIIDSIMTNISDSKLLENLAKELVHLKIFVRYQKVRGQIGGELEAALLKLIDKIYDAINKGDAGKIVDVSKRARIFLDSVVTMAKSKG